MNTHIGIIGDFSESVIAHQAINRSIEIANNHFHKSGDQKIVGHWLATHEDFHQKLGNYQALWCAPASPYRNTDNALAAIRFARESNTPFLGTCGGYQHAALEFARNILGYSEAENAELKPNCSMPLISALVCSLVEKNDAISIPDCDTKLHQIYQANQATEDYHCSFGVNPNYLPIFDNSALKFSAFSSEGEPRALEIREHRFFIGTAFQPERRSYNNQLHPIVEDFIRSAIENSCNDRT